MLIPLRRYYFQNLSPVSFTQDRLKRVFPIYQGYGDILNKSSVLMFKKMLIQISYPYATGISIVEINGFNSVQGRMISYHQRNTFCLFILNLVTRRVKIKFVFIHFSANYLLQLISWKKPRLQVSLMFVKIILIKACTSKIWVWAIDILVCSGCDEV